MTTPVAAMVLTTDRPLAVGSCGHWWHPLPPGDDVQIGVWLAELRARFATAAGDIRWHCPRCDDPVFASIIGTWREAIP